MPQYIEDALKLYVDPLEEPIEEVSDKYIKHIEDLLGLLRSGNFKQADIIRKSYNVIQSSNG